MAAQILQSGSRSVQYERRCGAGLIFSGSSQHSLLYAFVENQTDHEHEGRDPKIIWLHRASRASNHGDPVTWDDGGTNCLSKLKVDMTISPDGKPITIDKRLEDIEKQI